MGAVSTLSPHENARGSSAARTPRVAPPTGRWWRQTLWSLLYPRRVQKVMPTLSGLLLIGLALAIGVAAYNTANNILFITLSLLLSCLLLSGVLSWLNFTRVSWRLSATPPLRVGQTATAAVAVRNEKALLPTYGLHFEVNNSSSSGTTSLLLRERLDARGAEVRLEWLFRPVRRGREQFELRAISSSFPFGLLRKTLHRSLRHEVLVWPAPVTYQALRISATARPLNGEQVSRVGQGGDLLALRRYQTGDSHRLIHWKASARLQTLMIRQFASENQRNLSLWVETDPQRWPRPEQFELLCSLAASLAEDLFTAGRLGSVAIDQEPPQAVRRLRDLETFFDRLALLEHGRAVVPTPVPAGGGAPRSRKNLLIFAPEGTRGVAAYVDGHKAAAA